MRKLMKFVRLNEYRPERTADVLEALAFYSHLRALTNELRTALVASGRIVTATINFLQIKIAQSSSDIAEKEKLLSYRMGDELIKIKQQFPDPEERKRVISEWFNKKDGFKDALWMQLDAYGKTLKNYVKKQYNVSEPVAEEAVHEALAYVMTGTDKSGETPIIQTLMNYDASQGTLAFDYIKGKLNFSVRPFLDKYFNQQSKETSTNQKIGDNDNTEVGDMIAAPENSDEYDIKSYSESADRFINYFEAKINEMIAENNSPQTSPAQKELNKSLLTKFKKEDNELRVMVYQLKELAEIIDKCDNGIAQRKTAIQDTLNYFANEKNPDKNAFEAARANVLKWNEGIKKRTDKKNQAIKEFENIKLALDDMRQFDNSGNLMSNPEMPSQNPAQNVIDTPVVKPVEIEEHKLRKTPKPGREVVTPENLNAIKQNQIPPRDRLLPWIYKSVKGKFGNPGGFLQIPFIKANIQTPEEYQALLSGDYSGLQAEQTANVIYTNIITKAILELRDLQVINKKYDTLEMAQNEAPKQWFINRVVSDINNNEVLKNLEQTQICLNKFDEWITKGDDSFRSIYLKIDSWLRGSAYNEVKNEMFGDKQWSELSDEERKQIAEKVYQEQYETGVRRFYLANPAKIVQHGARIPVPSTHEKEYYLDKMGYEVGQIGQGNTNWFATESDPERLLFKKKKDQTRRSPVKNTDTQEPVVNPQAINGEDTFADVLDSFVKLANVYDSMGMYERADSIHFKMNKLIYG